jgi:hypothetical protein
MAVTGNLLNKNIYGLAKVTISNGANISYYGSGNIGDLYVLGDLTLEDRLNVVNLTIEGNVHSDGYEINVENDLKIKDSGRLNGEGNEIEVEGDFDSTGYFESDLSVHGNTNVLGVISNNLELTLIGKGEADLGQWRPKLIIKGGADITLIGSGSQVYEKITINEQGRLEYGNDLSIDTLFLYGELDLSTKRLIVSEEYFNQGGTLKTLDIVLKNDVRTTSTVEVGRINIGINDKIIFENDIKINTLVLEGQLTNKATLNIQTLDNSGTLIHRGGSLSIDNMDIDSGTISLSPKDNVFDYDAEDIPTDFYNLTVSSNINIESPIDIYGKLTADGSDYVSVINQTQHINLYGDLLNEMNHGETFAISGCVIKLGSGNMSGKVSIDKFVAEGNLSLSIEEDSVLTFKEILTLSGNTSGNIVLGDSGKDYYVNVNGSETTINLAEIYNAYFDVDTTAINSKIDDSTNISSDDATSGDDASDDATSGDASSDDATSGDDASDDATSGDDASDDATSGDDASDDASSGDATSDDASNGSSSVDEYSDENGEDGELYDPFSEDTVLDQKIENKVAELIESDKIENKVEVIKNILKDIIVDIPLNQSYKKQTKTEDFSITIFRATDTARSVEAIDESIANLKGVPKGNIIAVSTFKDQKEELPENAVGDLIAMNMVNKDGEEINKGFEITISFPVENKYNYFLLRRQSNGKFVDSHYSKSYHDGKVLFVMTQFSEYVLTRKEIGLINSSTGGGCLFR